ncbi:MAG: hypothetical protein JXB38_19775 [Anaerolineales bacterium]|nr:hypothetical protein [Anaerolineales bacterium]
MKTTRKPGRYYCLIVLTALSGILGACQPAEAPEPDLPAAVLETALPSPTAILPTGAPTAIEAVSFEATSELPDIDELIYMSQAGDSVEGLAARFGVAPGEIVWLDAPAETTLWDSYPGFIDPSLRLSIPHVLTASSLAARLIPDSEVIFSATAADFDVTAYLAGCGGFLASYQASDFVSAPKSSGEVVQLVGLENSINPRLLLAILEYYSGCVQGELATGVSSDYLMGVDGWQYKGLYNQLVWLVEELTAGYYGWRDGSLTEITLQDGSEVRLEPTLNAGTVAVQYAFAQLYDQASWEQALDPQTGFAALYTELFGDPWQRAEAVEPLLPAGFAQPPMELPFLPGHTWSYTSGPHSAWEQNGAPAALDFTPSSTEVTCAPSYEWVAAAASGEIVRVGEGLIVQDLDGDGSEHTGWVLVYVHVHLDRSDLFQVGTWLEAGQLIGHPSCEGGPSQSTHLHIARKYNGEWMLAGGPEPFNLDGWQAVAGAEPYDGYLVKDGVVIEANDMALRNSYIKKPRPTPKAGQ